MTVAATGRAVPPNGGKRSHSGRAGELRAPRPNGGRKARLGDVTDHPLYGKQKNPPGPARLEALPNPPQTAEKRAETGVVAEHLSHVVRVLVWDSNPTTGPV